MILTGKTIVSALRPPYPYGGEFVSQFLFALQAVLVPAARLDGRLRLRRARPAGRQLPRPVRRARPPRRLLRARLDPRVRAVRDGDRARRRGRHRDHRRPRRAQDPRGARRAAGARRRPGQEPRRPALPRADARHRPVRHLRAAVRHLRRHPRHARQRRPARPVLGDLLHQRLGHGPLGVGPQVHHVRRDHRDRLLLQGHDRVGWRRGGGPRRQPGGRDRDPGRVRVQLRVHPDAARDPSRDHGDQADEHRLAQRPAGTGSPRSARSSSSARASSAEVFTLACCASSARRCARPAS